MDELLAIVGGSWQPLLLYPGAVTTLLLALLVNILWRRADTERSSSVGPATLAVFAVACPLLVCAMTPTPRSYWAYPLDLIVALALLEVPHWLRLAHRLQHSDTQRAATAEAATLLNVYPLLALACAALGQAAGSLLLPELRAGQGILRWVGLVTWAVTMPPLLGLGPWRTARDQIDDLRRAAHLVLLVAIALPSGDRWGYSGPALAAVAAIGCLTMLHYIWRGDARRWERLQPLVALVVLICLLWIGTNAWMARMQ